MHTTETAQLTVKRTGDHIDILNRRGHVVATLYDGYNHIVHDPFADSYAVIMREPRTDWPQTIANAGLNPDTIRAIDSMPIPDVNT